MAYGIKYYSEYQKSGKTFRVDIEKDGYASGTTLISTLMPDTVQIKRRGSSSDKDKVVLGSELIFNFYSTASDNGQFDEIFTGAYKDWRLSYYTDSVLTWRGWIKPENLTRDFVNNQYELRLSASDGLADLQDIDYPAATGRTTLLNIVKNCIAEIGIELDFSVVLSTEENTLMLSTDCALNVVDAEVKRFTVTKDGRTTQTDCLEVLEGVLKPFNVTLEQADGNWWIVAQHETGAVPLFEYVYSSLAETRTASFNLTQDLSGFQYNDRGNLTRLPIVKKHEVTFRNRNLGDTLITNGDFSSGITGWTSNDFFQFLASGGAGRMVSEITPANNTGTDLYIQNANFSETPTGASDKIAITYRVKPGGVLPDNDTYVPFFECQLFDDTTQITAESFARRRLIRGADWVTYTDIFPLTAASTKLNVRFELTSASVGDYDSISVDVDDVVSQTIFSDGSEITFDTTTGVINTASEAYLKTESEVFFGDSGDENDLGAYEVSGTLTSDWKRYGKTEALTIQNQYALNKVTDNSAFKNYISVGIMDLSDVLSVHHRFNIEGVLYRVINYEKRHSERLFLADLEEIITTDPTHTTEIYVLSTVDGNSTSAVDSSVVVSGAIIDDSVTTLDRAWSGTKISTDFEPKDADITKANEAETISGAWTFSTNPRANDNIAIELGTGADWMIFSSGTHMYIDQQRSTADDIFIRNTSNQAKFKFDISTGDLHTDGDVVAYSTSVP